MSQTQPIEIVDSDAEKTMTQPPATKRMKDEPDAKDNQSEGSQEEENVDYDSDERSSSSRDEETWDILLNLNNYKIESVKLMCKPGPETKFGEELDTLPSNFKSNFLDFLDNLRDYLDEDVLHQIFVNEAVLSVMMRPRSDVVTLFVPDNVDKCEVDEAFFNAVNTEFIRTWQGTSLVFVDGVSSRLMLLEDQLKNVCKLEFLPCDMMVDFSKETNECQSVLVLFHAVKI